MVVDMTQKPTAMLLAMINQQNNTGFAESDLNIRAPQVIAGAVEEDVTVGDTTVKITRNTSVDIDVLTDEVQDDFVTFKYQRISLTTLFSLCNPVIREVDIKTDGNVSLATVISEILRKYKLAALEEDFTYVLTQNQIVLTAKPTNLSYIDNTTIAIEQSLLSRVLNVDLNGFEIPMPAGSVMAMRAVACNDLRFTGRQFDRGDHAVCLRIASGKLNITKTNYETLAVTDVVVTDGIFGQIVDDGFAIAFIPNSDELMMFGYERIGDNRVMNAIRINHVDGTVVSKISTMIGAAYSIQDSYGAMDAHFDGNNKYTFIVGRNNGAESEEIALCEATVTDTLTVVMKDIAMPATKIAGPEHVRLDGTRFVICSMECTNWTEYYVSYVDIAEASPVQTVVGSVGEYVASAQAGSNSFIVNDGKVFVPQMSRMQGDGPGIMIFVDLDSKVIKRIEFNTLRAGSDVTFDFTVSAGMNDVTVATNKGLLQVVFGMANPITEAKVFTVPYALFK